MNKPKIRLKEGGGILKKFGVYAIAVVLVAGVVLGTGIWLADVDVPISYEEPYKIQMSESETEDYDFETIGFKETTEWAEADFEKNDEDTQDRHYHQHVRIDNPEGTGDVAVDVEIEEPSGWDDWMGFTIYEIEEDEDFADYEPGEVDIEVEKWGIISHEENVPEGETGKFTVVYSLGFDAPEPDEYEVRWSFSERNSANVPDDYDTIEAAIDGVDEDTTIFVESEGNTYVEDVEVNKAGITLYGVGEPTIEGRVSITEDRVTLDGFDVSPPDATDGAEAEAVIIQDSADYVTIKNNLVRDFSEDGIDQWEGIDGIVAFGGDEDDPVRNPVIIDNEVENLEGRNEDGGAAGISIQGNVIGATVEGNEVHDIGEETAWAFGIVVRGTGNHDVVPTDVEISDNEVNIILSNPDTDTVGVGIGLESGDAGDVEFEDNDISTTEFLLEDKTATMDLKAFAESNTLDRGAMLEEADFDGDIRNVIFNSIQAAVDAAETGNTIEVVPGTYTEDDGLEVDVEGLTLISHEGPEETTIEVDGTDRAIDMDADNIRIEGFTVDNFGETAFYTGEHHLGEAADNFEIVNNIVPEDVASHGVSTAINIADATGGLIEGNEFYSQFVEHPDGDYGTGVVSLISTSDIEIRDNTISMGAPELLDRGLTTAWTSGTTIEDNTFTGNVDDLAVRRVDGEYDLETVAADNTFDPGYEIIEEEDRIVLSED